MKLIIEASTEDIIDIIHGLKIDEIVITAPSSEELETVRKSTSYSEAETDQFVSQYAAIPGRRRSKLEMAKCDKEEELGRFLTPEEEGAIEADFEDEISRKEQAKERAKAQARIKQVEAEITADADTEDSISFSITSEEPAEDSQRDEAPESLKQEAKDTSGSTVPTADPLTNISSLFS
jgi:hypothetical protein